MEGHSTTVASDVFALGMVRQPRFLSIYPPDCFYFVDYPGTADPSNRLHQRNLTIILSQELHTGAPPFARIKNDIAVLLKYQHGERPPRPTTDSLKPRNTADVCVEMDNATWTLVQECWQQDDERRPSTKEVLRRLKRRRGRSRIK